MTTEEKSFFQNIWENKFVKFTLPYVIGAWGFVQVAAFLESRYSWANGWPDFILIFALAMLPSVFLFSYFRGTNLKQLAKVEKFFIPINLVLAIIIAVMGLGKSDLEHASSKVAVLNEEGETVERVVPNISSIKRVVLLPWEDKANDPDLQWMTFALPTVLSADLEQDSRLISISPKLLASAYDEYSASLSKTPPFAIQRKIANDNYSDFFLNGSIEKTGDNYQVTATLINTKDGKEFYTKKYENTDPLTIVDNISEDFRKEVYVENELEDDFIDLPVSNLYTNSTEALKAYTLSIQQAYFRNNMMAAIDYAKQAVSIDPNFAIAYAGLSDYNAMLNQLEASKLAITKAMKLKDALSERMQLGIKFGYMNFESPIKALNLLEMWSQLYPKDYKPYELLIRLYRLRGEAEKAKTTALRALDNGHTGAILLTLANLENAQGNAQKAEEYYSRFEKEFPHKMKDVFGKGNIYLSQGDFDKAREHFEKMHLMDPDKASIITKLAEIEQKSGNFAKSMELFDDALATEKQFRDSLSIMQKKEMLYLNLGQVDTYFSEMEKRWQLMTKIVSFNQVQAEMIYAYNIEALFDKGQEKGLLDRLLEITGKLDKTIADLDCIVKGNYYIYANDKENLNKTLEEGCMDEFKKLQTDVQISMVYAFVEKINGNYPKAIEHLEAILKTSKLDPASLSFFGEIYRLNKNYDKAEQQLEASLKANPFDTKVLYQLALTYQEQDKKEATKAILEKLVDTFKGADADFIPAIKAREMLAGY